jgi:hypothetical protein
VTGPAGTRCGDDDDAAAHRSLRSRSRPQHP